MAPVPRMELVGKRFVCVGDSGRELDVSRIHEWHWRAGVIRAVSYRESSNRELSVYVEFDDLEWEKREWVKVYEDFKIFLVEHQLVWAERKNPNQTQGSKSKQVQWPALFPIVRASKSDIIFSSQKLINKFPHAWYFAYYVESFFSPVN
ncbi:probable JmjC domain-containing histone demethylation protein 2C isoform X3 [Chiloscyllium plagiosum]|uniref:probable JmjC domain-containing histone demethylation protein 2C isoform X3 n=1 Tax=Chiloscyllium plagiosum TaxID=36176 RepID=UPI001CB86D1E|nr:probable JmjC domain-containing histone demethylation protein 2C isoform X3 [Chiloscyllium plagiosum]